jgi:hypothetical protein
MTSATGLLAAGTVLAASNWYLRPGQSLAWAAALLVLGAVVFGGAIVVGALGLAFATSVLDGAGSHDRSQRATMVFWGLFFVVTGNALPKMLTPLPALQCAAAKVQAFQRFAGWAWVLMGLAFVAIALALPMDSAKPASQLLLVGGTLAVATRLARLLLVRRREA